MDAATAGATAGAVARAAPGTLSPRCSPRIALTGAGLDAHLQRPGARAMAEAVAGARAVAREGGAAGGGTLREALGGASPPRAPLGSLAASLARGEAERVLAQALHGGAAGFLPVASPRPGFTSRRGDLLSQS